jgi:putative ABC transport system permease protein
MRAIVTKIAGDLRRRRLQVYIVALIVALAAGVGTVAIALMRESAAPYATAFDQYQGAHLTALFDGAKATPDQLAATAQSPEVTASAGPWQTAQLPAVYGAQKSPIQIIARADPGGPVDRLLITSGRWATQPGEITLTYSYAQSIGAGVGKHLIVLSGANRWDLVIVGEIADIDEATTANFSPQYAWVQPAEFATLAPAGQPSSLMMLYRFRHAATGADLQRRVEEISAVLPSGAVSATLTHLVIQQIFGLTTTLTLTFLLAFAVFALGAAALIVANVVSGAVLTSQREIGVIKALGFTPGQVVTSFVGLMLVPALIGCAIGAPLGVLGSQPLLRSSAEALGLPVDLSFDPLAPLLAVFGSLLVVAIAAAIPALRAGLLRPVDAITQSATPDRQRRSWLGTLAQAAHLPRPASLGASDAYARPVRGLLTTVAVVIGVATLVFALGLSATFQKIEQNPGLTGAADVTISRYGDYPDSQLTATLEAQPETERAIAFDFFWMSGPQLSSPVNTLAIRGDSAALDYPILAGRWFQGPGEIVGGPAFLKEAHLAIGDTFTATINGRPIPLHVVGEYFTFANFGRAAAIDWSTYSAANPDAQPHNYLIDLHAGANGAAYAQRVEATAPDYLNVTTSALMYGAASVIAILNVVLAALVAILAAIAIAGVFNTLLLTSYERVRDTATLKALGMTPRQVVGMVVVSACVLGVVGGVIGVPVGVWLHQSLLALMGTAVGEAMPSGITQSAYNPAILPLLALAGVLVAAIGAALPAVMASRQPVAEALRAE